MTNKVQPIKPSEVAGNKVVRFPDEVFEAFNELITEKFSDGRACVRQEDVVLRMIEKGLKRDDIFKNGWLNVEDAYSQQGWGVEYDKPAYNETYPATFTFIVRRRKA